MQKLRSKPGQLPNGYIAQNLGPTQLTWRGHIPEEVYSENTVERERNHESLPWTWSVVASLGVLGSSRTSLAAKK